MEITVRPGPEGKTAILDFSFPGEEEGGKVCGSIVSAFVQKRLPKAIIVSPVLSSWRIALLTPPESVKEVLQSLRKLLGDDPATSAFLMTEKRPWAGVFPY